MRLQLGIIVQALSSTSLSRPSETLGVRECLVVVREGPYLGQAH